jgi:adenine nucleotide transporter 17
MVITGPPAVLTPPPIAHAAAGCVGSALSLFLFYPLERARIELQAHAPDDDNDYSHTFSNNSTSTTIGSRRNICFSQPIKRLPDKRTWHQRNRSIVACLVRLRERRQLYRGVKPVVATLALSNFIFFYALQVCKQLFTVRYNSYSESAYHALLATTLAGIVNVLLTNPLWVVNLRLVQGDEDLDVANYPSRGNTGKRGFLDILQDIARNEGIGQLWSGTGASLLLVSNPAIQLFIYEQGKNSLLQQQTRSFLKPFRQVIQGEHRLDFSNTLNPLEAFFLGALSKGIATVLTYPLQLAQVIVRLQRENRLVASSVESTSKTQKRTENSYQTLASQHSRRFRGTWDCIFQLYRKGGILALYTGMDAKLLLNILSAAFTFLTYEQILIFITTGRIIKL